MKPTGDYDYEVVIWQKNWGIYTEKTSAPDAIVAINNVTNPLKAKYGDDVELIVMSVKRGSWTVK